MKILNKDLSFREIYIQIRDRKNLDFIANRNDIGFANIENEFTTINFNFPFPLPELQNLKEVTRILLEDSIGMVNMELYQRLRLLVKIFNGHIFYQRIDKGDAWRVMIVFQ